MVVDRRLPPHTNRRPVLESERLELAGARCWGSGQLSFAATVFLDLYSRCRWRALDLKLVLLRVQTCEVLGNASDGDARWVCLEQ